MPAVFKQHTYVVYERGARDPLVADATPEECAKAMNVTLGTFKSILTKAPLGLSSKWKVFRSVDSVEHESHRPQEYAPSRKLGKIDWDIIEHTHNGIKNRSKLSETLYVSQQAIDYHRRKITKVTGLDLRDPEDLEKLYEMKKAHLL